MILQNNMFEFCPNSYALYSNISSFALFSLYFYSRATIDIDSSNTSPSYSPSFPDMALTPNFEVGNILSINNNNKITTKQHQQHHSERSPSVNDGINENILPELSENQGTETATKDIERTLSDTGVAFSPINNTARPSSKSHNEQPTMMTPTKNKGEGKLGKYGKINGTTSQSTSNTTNNNVEGSYQCTFCEKNFPRLGYLKKHEQVSDKYLARLSL